MVNNSLSQDVRRQSPEAQFKSFMKSEVVQQNLMSTLGDMTRARGFTASIITAVNMNGELAKCKHASIVSAALLGETLKLSPSPQLGQYYMVPYKQKEKRDRNGNVTEPECTVATFTLGYRGFIQLAIRSGQYKKLIVTNIKEGELISWNPMTEDIEVKPILDDDERSARKTIGYYCFFELINGFRKSMYWSKEKMLAHADRYSQAFSKNGGAFGYNGKYRRVSFADYEAGKYPKNDEWMYSSFWYKDFDGMAYKTMLRQIISRWGVMSVDMQAAYTNDNHYKTSLDEDAVAQYAEEIPEETEIENVEVVEPVKPEPTKPEPAKTELRSEPDIPVMDDMPEPIEYSTSLF